MGAPENLLLMSSELSEQERRVRLTLHLWQEPASPRQPGPDLKELHGRGWGGGRQAGKDAGGDNL